MLKYNLNKLDVWVNQLITLGIRHKTTKMKRVASAFDVSFDYTSV